MCGTDLAACREEAIRLGLRGLQVGLQGEGIVFDMLLLADCDYFIGHAVYPHVGHCSAVPTCRTVHCPAHVHVRTFVHDASLIQIARCTACISPHITICSLTLTKTVTATMTVTLTVTVYLM